MQLITLNSLWYSLGLTEFSFLGFLKIIFIIFFIFLHIYLLYSEFLKIEQKEKENLETLSYVQAGTAPELKKIATYILGTVSLYASLITINDHYTKKNKEEILNQKIDTINDKFQRVQDGNTVINYKQKSHLDSIARGYKELEEIRLERSKLKKEIEETESNPDPLTTNSKLKQQILENKDKAKFKEDYNEHEFTDKIRSAKSQDFLLKLQEERAETALKKDIDTAVKFNTWVSEEKDGQKILDTINEYIKKSSILNLDDIFTKLNYETFKKLYEKFDSMDGISQLAFSLVLQSSLIL
jgi:hypothetical protein